MIAEGAVAVSPPGVAWSRQTADQFPPTVAAAPGGGVYVTSTTDGTGVGVLSRYAPGGAEVWRVQIGGGGTRVENVASDAAGNAYVAGEIYGSLDGYSQGAGDVFVRKYSAGGDLVWGRQFGTALYDWPVGLAVTAAGTAYVTSGPWATNYSVPPAGTYTTVRSYSADGSEGWVSEVNTGDGTYPGNTAAGSQGTAVDGAGNVVASFSNYTQDGNFTGMVNYLSKTGADGTVQWVKTLSGGTNQVGTAVDAANNIYLASAGLAKYDPAGNLIWNVGGGQFTLLTDCVGPDGTVYVGGFAGNSGYAAAYNAAGGLLWSQLVPLMGANSARVEGMTLSGGQLVVTEMLATGSTWSGNGIVAYSVPEPGACLVVVGALVTGWRRRRGA